MSTSVKDLSPVQIVFRRPAFALGVVVILAMIWAKPSYNTLPVLLAIPLYWILYQCRYYIYRLGMGRFDFLAFLFYFPFVLSAMFDWKYGDSGALTQFAKIQWWSVITVSSYQEQVMAWLWQNLDALIHWKMIMFTPAIAGFLYLIFVEFDRRAVKTADLQNLGLTDSDLFKRGGLLDSAAMLLFVLITFLYGLHCMFAAVVIIAALVFLAPVIYVWFAFGCGLCLFVLGYAHFNYIMFLSIPTQFTRIVAANGLWHSVFAVIKYNLEHNFGQWYILIPYLIFSGAIAVISTLYRVRVADVACEQEKAQEIASTVDAIDFGIEISSRKAVRLTHQELNTHMYINGASGSGKTVAMMNFVVEAAEKSLPLIYIDGKGATDLEESMAKIAAKYNRVFKVFTLSPDSVPETSPYDFLGAGTFTEKKNRIMQLFITADAAGVSYYQDNLEMFINRVFMIIHHQQLKIDLFRFLQLISNINDLIEMADSDVVLEDGSKVNLKSYFEEVRNMKPDSSPRTRIITKLDPFIHSSYGHLFSVIGKQNIINIKDSIKNGEIVLFLFDASAFALDTERVAKMVISDINATFAEFGKIKQPIKTFCCFDEFKSYETKAIASTIALHRSNGMHAIIGTQSLALIDKEVGDAILTNCQTHFIMASADKDAERFAMEFGTANKIEYTTRIKADVQEVSDITTKRVRDVVIDKQDIKDIRVGLGQGYLHRKAIGGKPVKIQVHKKI